MSESALAQLMEQFGIAAQFVHGLNHALNPVVDRRWCASGFAAIGDAPGFTCGMRSRENHFAVFARRRRKLAALEQLGAD